MAQRLDGFVLFSTHPDGFNQDEVGAYIAKIHQQYEHLYKENQRLKRQLRKTTGQTRYEVTTDTKSHDQKHLQTATGN